MDATRTATRILARPASMRPTCPHCGGSRIEAHGSYALKDGTRVPRQICRTCGRTSNRNTGKPLAYIKKRTEFVALAESMDVQHSLRSAARRLHVWVSTAFRWRHRLLSALAAQPPAPLSGLVVAGEVFVPYSEKGSRKTDGPGAWGRHARIAKTGQRVWPLFRRMVEGRPSCVLIAATEKRKVIALVGQGRPTPETLQASLRQILGAGARLQASGIAPYTQACRHLGIPHEEAGGRPPAWPTAGSICRRFYSWLQFFRGIATRHLPNYLVWYYSRPRLAV